MEYAIGPDSETFFHSVVLTKLKPCWCCPTLNIAHLTLTVLRSKAITAYQALQFSLLILLAQARFCIPPRSVGALPLSSVNRSHHARMPSQEGVHSERSVQDDKGWQIPPSALHLSPKHSLLGQILQVPGFWDMRI